MSDTHSRDDDRTADRDVIPETVVCFDRDHTVDVNPHPERDAVPLAWVKYLAHEVDPVDVWATGNQRLCEEAVVPGVSEALARWDMLTADADDETYYEYAPVGIRKPGRREGLRLVEQLYRWELEAAADGIEFVVVDDVDLSDLREEGWTHYFPWEFTRAVERGTGPVEIPHSISVSNVPATDPDCPESYPPLEYDTDPTRR